MQKVQKCQTPVIDCHSMLTEEHVLDTNAGKQLFSDATDV
jgi:hypothetical protein